MDVALVLTGRSPEPMGLELAEERLVQALRQSADGATVDVRVVGGRAARGTARRLGGRWYPARPGRAPKRLWRGVDLVHLAGPVPTPPRALPFVVTVHDLAPLHFDDEGPLPPSTAELVGRAALCICPSEFTASELESQLAVPRDRIRVVPNGPGQQVAPPPEPLSAAELAGLGIDLPFVLRLGGYTRRKNLALLAAAWPAVRRGVRAGLVLAGPPQPWRSSAVGTLARAPGVTMLDYVPSEVVSRLIRSAACLVTTSTYEGFGLPALEAMALGTPVVALRAPFSEEVCGDAGLLVGDDPAELADALVRVVADPAFAEGLRAAGLARARAFSWERSAEELLRAYRDARESQSA